MSETIISVENLSKRYFVRHQAAKRERIWTLRDAIASDARNLARKTFNTLSRRQIPQRRDDIEEFWALRNVSFEIKRGEVVGIIGRNGAGKSTLLKILSRITEPTEGRVTLRGRVASLLEVGTGFHQELTGRENIFLNGAILGMTRQEIKKKFDEIVAFAEVERFLDTPVKRYSSGMYVRLAFAVAAHLDPEILVVDEVLAVGDAEFQRKCLGKMEDASRREGRTVLLVSHNLATVSALASRGLVMNSGRLVTDATVAEAISTYLSGFSKQSVYIAPTHAKFSGPHIKKLEVLTSDPNGIQQFDRQLEVKIWINHARPMRKACLSLNIVNQYQHSVVHAWAFNPEHSYGTQPGETVLRCVFPRLRLNVGRYHIRTYLAEAPGGEFYEKLDGLCSFEVVRTDVPILWGWNPDHCVYHEDWGWEVVQIAGDNLC